MLMIYQVWECLIELEEMDGGVQTRYDSNNNNNNDYNNNNNNNFYYYYYYYYYYYSITYQMGREWEEEEK